MAIRCKTGVCSGEGWGILVPGLLAKAAPAARLQGMWRKGRRARVSPAAGCTGHLTLPHAVGERLPSSSPGGTQHPPPPTHIIGTLRGLGARCCLPTLPHLPPCGSGQCRAWGLRAGLDLGRGCGQRAGERCHMRSSVAQSSLPLPWARNPQERGLRSLRRTAPHKARQKKLLGLGTSLFSCVEGRRSCLLSALRASCCTALSPG